MQFFRCAFSVTNLFGGTARPAVALSRAQILVTLNAHFVTLNARFVRVKAQFVTLNAHSVLREDGFFTVCNTKRTLLPFR